MYQHTCCQWKSKTYPACFYKAGCRESWFWDCKRAGYRAKIRRAALYRTERGPFYRDTYHRKILSCQIQWNCRKITKTVPWTGYTDIQRCKMTREMTMTALKCRFCRFMCRFGRGAFAWQSGSVIIRHIGARSLKGHSGRLCRYGGFRK